MSLSKLIVASLLLSFVLFCFVNADDDQTPQVDTNTQKQGPAQKIDCSSACAARCRLASRQRMCHRACGTCCRRCNCVPPGTSGNQNMCPCYASLTTHGGRRKCP